MNSEPYKLHGNQWALNVDAEAQQRLDDETIVPGIRFDPYRNRVIGSIDAVAAACMRLGVEGPDQQSSQQPPGTADLPHVLPYQRLGVEMLYSTQAMSGGALLADDPGCGKTLQAITLARLRGSKRVVIVAPGFARYTWQDELLKWGEPASEVCLMLPKGDKLYKRNLDKAPVARWVVTSHELLPNIPTRRYPDFFIIDECHQIKGRQTLRTQATKNLAAMAPYRLGISATPAWNRPRDWWMVLTILFGRIFGSAHEFEAAYCAGHQGAYGWVADGLSRADELRKRLSYYTTRREKREVIAQLPPKTRQVVWLDPNPNATNKLRAAMLKAVTIQSALEATLEAKMPAAVQLAHQHQRFLLFTYRRDHAEAMQQQIYSQGTKCVLMHGGMSVTARHEAVVQARSQQVGIVATLDSAGQSLNLQNIASVGIMHALDYVPAKTIQAEDRGHRMDSTSPFHWIYLALRESMDKFVWDTVISKLDQMMALMPGQTTARELAGASVEVYDEAQARANIYAAMEELSDE